MSEVVSILCPSLAIVLTNMFIPVVCSGVVVLVRRDSNLSRRCEHSYLLPHSSCKQFNSHMCKSETHRYRTWMHRKYIIIIKYKQLYKRYYQYVLTIREDSSYATFLAAMLHVNLLISEHRLSDAAVSQGITDVVRVRAEVNPIRRVSQT